MRIRNITLLRRTGRVIAVTIYAVRSLRMPCRMHAHARVCRVIILRVDDRATDHAFIEFSI